MKYKRLYEEKAVELRRAELRERDLLSELKATKNKLREQENLTLVNNRHNLILEEELHWLRNTLRLVIVPADKAEKKDKNDRKDFDINGMR